MTMLPSKLDLSAGDDNVGTLFSQTLFVDPPAVDLLEDLIKNHTNEFNQCSPFLMRLVVMGTKPSAKQALKVLLDFGADPNVLYEGRHCLVQAAETASPDVVKLLLDKGADPEATDCLVAANEEEGSYSGSDVSKDRNSGRSSIRSCPHGTDCQLSAENVALRRRKDGKNDEVARMIHKAKHKKPNQHYQKVVKICEKLLCQPAGEGFETDEEVLENCLTDLIRDRNECIGCQNRAGKCLVEILRDKNYSKCLKTLFESEVASRIDTWLLVGFVFSKNTQLDLFTLLIRIRPVLLSSVSPIDDVSLLQHLIEEDDVDCKRIRVVLSFIEQMAKSEEEQEIPVDISKIDYEGGTILHMACKVANVAIVDLIIHTLKVLTDTKKCERSLKEVLDYSNKSRRAQLNCEQTCLQIALRRSDLSKDKKLKLIETLLRNGADPNLQFGFQASDHHCTSALLEAASEMDVEVGGEIVGLLMDYGAIDKDHKALYGAVSSHDHTMTQLLLVNGWPPFPDTYQCHYCQHKNNIPNCALINQLEKCLESYAFSMDKMADNKVLFSRQLPAHLFPDNVASTGSSTGLFSSERKKLLKKSNIILEALQIEFSELDIYSDINHDLIVDSIANYFRKTVINSLLRENKVKKMLLLDLVTTVKIEKCMTFETLDVKFFTEFHSLKHLIVTNNKMLTKLPADLGVDNNPSSGGGGGGDHGGKERGKQCTVNSPIEDLQLDRNSLVSIPAWVFRMRKLKTLSVSCNNLTDMPLEMWVSFGLEELNLSGNLSLTKLPNAHLMTAADCGSRPILNADTNADTMHHAGSGSNNRENRGADGSKNAADVDSCSLNGNGGSRGGLNDTCNEMIPAEYFHNSKKNVSKLSFFDNHYNPASEAKPQQWLRFDESEHSYGMKLHTLSLNNCSLTELPENLACLAPRLAYLNCKKNNISQISLSEQFPYSVARLDFESNRIKSINYLNLKHLTCFRTNESALTDMETSRATFPQTETPFQDSYVKRCYHNIHARLDSLQSLDLSFNKELTSVDFEYLRKEKNNIKLPSCKLPNLSNLFLNDCSLTEISNTISAMKSLRWLSVSNNYRITTIPEDFALLEKLQNFNFDGCSISDETLRAKGQTGSAKEIRRYLSAQREGKTSWRRMKLMFMGDSDAGKTSLVRALARSHFGVSMDAYAGVMRFAMRQHLIEPQRAEQEAKQNTLSTVGVNVSDWAYPRENKPDQPRIWFDTWDFAGQEVYQVTHQYFLSRRCLYLLVFNLVEKQQSNGSYRIRDNASILKELKKWFNNIFCQFPNANFILVGTRRDYARTAENFVPEYFATLKQFLMNNTFRRGDDEFKNKCSGFPKILDVICVTLVEGKFEQIKKLCESIWREASLMKCDEIGPDKNRNLVDIEIPNKYREIEGWIKSLRQELKEQRREPILTEQQLMRRVNAFLLEKKLYQMDSFEFNAMIHFMHENGIILHYDSALLNDKYFVDPQWMADQLAQVITIKESQDYGSSGIVLIDKFLAQISKTPALKIFESWSSMFIPLLSQFEVALKFSEKYLLIPSSLPSEREHLSITNNQISQSSYCDVPTESVVQPDTTGFESLTTRRSKFTYANRRHQLSIFEDDSHSLIKTAPLPTLNASNNIGQLTEMKQQCNYEILDGPVPSSGELLGTNKDVLRVFIPEACDFECLAKFMVFSYIPFGFWARLIARVIADKRFSLTAGDIFVATPSFSPDADNDGCTSSMGTIDEEHSYLVKYCMNSSMSWRCWKTGFSLVLWGYIPIIEVKEVLCEEESGMKSPFANCPEIVKVRKQVLINATGQMARALNSTDKIELANGNKVEFREVNLNKSFPRQTLSIKVYLPHISILETKLMHNHTYREMSHFEPKLQTLASFFEQLSQHIDILLCEWYPNLGEVRFQQTAPNDHSVDRVIPCPHCLNAFDQPRIPVTIINLQFNLDDIYEFHHLTKFRRASMGLIRRTSEDQTAATIVRNNQHRKAGRFSTIDATNELTEDDDESSFSDCFKWPGRVNQEQGVPDESESTAIVGGYSGGREATVRDTPTLTPSEPPCRRPLVKSYSLVEREETPPRAKTTVGEKRTVEQFVRNYTSTIRGEMFDYSKDWRLYHKFGGDSQTQNRNKLRNNLNRGVNTSTLPHQQSFSDCNGGRLPPTLISPSSSQPSTQRSSTVYSHSSTIRIRQDTFDDAFLPKFYCFVEEEILLLACSGHTTLTCPDHWEIGIDEVSPNFLFIDLPPDKVLPKHMVQIDKYLGQGCFGAVFSGLITDPTKNETAKVPVAYKFYQPIKVEESFHASAEDRQGIESKHNQWLFEPTRSIADAYSELRKELSILMELQNPYIVAFYGASLSPIALILDKADMGDLASQLQLFREKNSILPPPAIRDVLFQLASALEYLHGHAYVHRDLKPANVLVWKFPRPHQSMSELSTKEAALVRLSDYGLTQKEISEGMLGKPGTMQYMAPEILAQDGREIYTNKIDIYSLGMIIFDLVCLIPPWSFVNYLELRTMVLEKKRPMITAIAKESPMAFLDLLCLCTLSHPGKRPNAHDIVEICHEQEICKLIECLFVEVTSPCEVANMGLSFVPGDTGPQLMNTVCVYSFPKLSPNRTSVSASATASANDRRRQFGSGKNKSPISSFSTEQCSKCTLNVNLLFYKDILRESINIEIDLKQFCENDETITAVWPIFKTFWVGTDYGNLIVLKLHGGHLFKVGQNSIDFSIQSITHLVHEKSGFSCALVLTSNGDVHLYKSHNEIHCDGGGDTRHHQHQQHSHSNVNDFTPMRLGTLKYPSRKVHSALLVSAAVPTTKNHSRLSKIENLPRRGSAVVTTPLSAAPSSARDKHRSPTQFFFGATPVTCLNLPDNLELWLSVAGSVIKRYRIEENNGEDNEESLLLSFTPVGPNLPYDKEMLFEGRLQVINLLALEHCDTVWGCGVKNRYIYMWNIKTLELKRIACSIDEKGSSSEDEWSRPPRRKHAMSGFDFDETTDEGGLSGAWELVDEEEDDFIMQVKDIKGFNQCVYVAINNGNVLVYDGRNGCKLNEIKCYSKDTYRILPLQPLIGPQKSNLMEYYQSVFLAKQPTFLTFGSGHRNVLEQTFESLFLNQDDNKAVAVTSSSKIKQWQLYGDVTTQQNKRVVVKLWNCYGDDTARKSPKPPKLAMTKKQFSVPLESVFNNTDGGKSGKANQVEKNKEQVNKSLRFQLIREEDESTAAVGIAGKERPGDLSISDLTQLSYLNRIGEVDAADYENATAGLSRPPIRSQTQNEKPKNIKKHMSKLWHKGRPPWSKTFSEPSNTIKNTVGFFQTDILKKSGFVHYKFNLSAHFGHEIKLMDGQIRIKWAKGSIKVNETCTILILVNLPDQSFITKMRDTLQDDLYQVSPIINILVDPPQEFLKPVNVTYQFSMDEEYEKGETKAVQHIIFSSSSLFPDILLPLKRCVYSQPRVTYQTDLCCTPFCVISTSSMTDFELEEENEREKNDEDDYLDSDAVRLRRLLLDRIHLNKLLSNKLLSLHYLLVLYKENSQERCLTFSCFEMMSQFMKALELMPLKDCDIYPISNPKRAPDTKLEIRAFNRTIYLKVWEREVVSITQPKVSTAASFSFVTTSQTQHNNNNSNNDNKHFDQELSPSEGLPATAAAKNVFGLKYKVSYHLEFRKTSISSPTPKEEIEGSILLNNQQSDYLPQGKPGIKSSIFWSFLTAGERWTQLMESVSFEDNVIAAFQKLDNQEVLHRLSVFLNEKELNSVLEKIYGDDYDKIDCGKCSSLFQKQDILIDIVTCETVFERKTIVEALRSCVQSISFNDIPLSYRLTNYAALKAVNNLIQKFQYNSLSNRDNLAQLASNVQDIANTLLTTTSTRSCRTKSSNMSNQQ